MTLHIYSLETQQKLPESIIKQSEAGMSKSILEITGRLPLSLPLKSRDLKFLESTPIFNIIENGGSAYPSLGHKVTFLHGWKLQCTLWTTTRALLL
jgi:hypothetical protein